MEGRKQCLKLYLIPRNRSENIIKTVKIQPKLPFRTLRKWIQQHYQFPNNNTFQIFTKVGNWQLSSEDQFQEYLQYLFSHCYQDWDTLFIEEVDPAEVNERANIEDYSREEGGEKEDQKESGLGDKKEVFLQHHQMFQILEKADFKPATTVSPEQALANLTSFVRPNDPFLDYDNEQDLNLLKLTGVITKIESQF